MTDYIGALDQGTTSTRFMIFDRSGSEVARHQLEHRQILPEPGWVEHDPKEILDRTGEVIAAAMKSARIDSSQLAAIGITNQRETTVIWNARTGEPLYNAIVWQDTRTDRIVREIESAGKGGLIRKKAGLPPATYFSAGKIRWMLDNVEQVRDAVTKGEAVFGNLDTWLIWNLTGGPDGGARVTDVTNASRTMLMNLETLQWDEDLLGLFEIPRHAAAGDPALIGFQFLWSHAVPTVPSAEQFRSARTSAINRPPPSAQVCFTPGEAQKHLRDG